MAEEGELPAATYILNYIKSIIGETGNTEPLRYDTLWFEKYPLDQVENEWVKGTPDFILPIQNNGNAKYFKTEIKIKAQEFRKTQYGGTTGKGSFVPRYGCASFYLDVEPVYRNMIDFSQRTGLPKSKFIIAFVNEENTEHYLITLEQIETLLTNGWNGIDIATFWEGYGQKAYLIPKDATKALNTFNSETLLDLAMDSSILPS